MNLRDRIINDAHRAAVDVSARWMRTDAFEELAAAGRVTDRVLPDGSHLVCCERVGAVRAFDAETRRVTVVASDGKVNRYGDIDDPEGWLYEAFDKNPIVLMDHYYSVEAIVGVVTKHWKEGDLAMEEHLIDPPESGAASALVIAKLSAGSLKAVSRSFIPWKVERVEDPEGEKKAHYVMHDMELLETSWVAIPAVRDALRLDANPHETPAQARLSGASEVLSRLERTTMLAAIEARLDGGCHGNTGDRTTHPDA